MFLFFFSLPSMPFFPFPPSFLCVFIFLFEHSFLRWIFSGYGRSLFSLGQRWKSGAFFFFFRGAVVGMPHAFSFSFFPSEEKKNIFFFLFPPPKLGCILFSRLAKPDQTPPFPSLSFSPIMRRYLDSAPSF